MKKHSNITKSTLLKNVIGTAIYDLNGRRLTFKVVDYDGGVPYGYCNSKRWWGHLYPRYISTDKGELVVANRISLE